MRLVYITMGWVCGVVLASSMDTLSWAVLAGLMLVGVVIGWGSERYRIFNIALLMLALGGLRASLVPTTSDVAAYNLSGGLTIEGVIIDAPDVRDNRVQFRINTETVTRIGQTVETSGLVLVRAPRTTDVAYGDRVAVTGLLITPGEFDTFSYADFLARQGVYSIMTNAAVEVVSSGHGSTFYSTIYDLRRQANDLINDALPEPSAGLLTGILLGNERGISPELADDFSRVGASHVVAISGFNMVIIAGVVMALLNPGEKKRPWTAIIGLTVIGLYTIFVGANAAVLRAAVMSGVLIIGQAINRKTYVPASLAFVALGMSFFDPDVLWDISFQLSFFATLGLALYVDPMSKRFDALLFRLFPAPTARGLSSVLSEPLIVTIAAQILTLPLIILYFERLSLVALLVNLLIIPVQAPLLLFGGLATIIAFAVPVLAQVIYWIDMVLLSWTIGVVRVFADLPFADTEFRVDPRWITLYFVVVIGWALMQATQPDLWRDLARHVRRRAVLTTVLISGLGLAVLMVAVAFARPDDKLDVWFLDMGHSNAVFIETPGGAQILIDGGNFPSRLLTALGDRMPFVDREIDVLIVTQPDEFDTGALPSVLARYDVGVALMNGQPNQTDSFIQLQEALSDTQIIDIRAGYSVEFDDGVVLDILHPTTPPELGDALNEGVLVMRLIYDEVSFLLTGDISREAQAEMLLDARWQTSTVMQLPQHGTVRSLDADFVSAIQPQAIVLQSDPANRRGDPHGDVLALLGDTPILRTDDAGTVHLWTDGRDLWTATQMD